MAAMHAPLRCAAAPAAAPARRAGACRIAPAPRPAAPRRAPRAPAAGGSESLEALARQLSSAQPVRSKALKKRSVSQTLANRIRG
jgi:hypothetical protein